MTSIKKVFSNNFDLCCIIWKYIESSIICEPITSVYRSCSDLLGKKLLKYVFWFYGIFGLIGNLFALTLSVKLNDSTQSYVLLINFSDLLTSIYVLAISSADRYYKDIFIDVKEKWLNSVFCKFLGGLVTFSSLYSCGVVFLLTCERYQKIVKPFSFQFFYKFRFVMLTVLFLISITFSIFPLWFYKVNQKLLH